MTDEPPPDSGFDKWLLATAIEGLIALGVSVGTQAAARWLHERAEHADGTRRRAFYERLDAACFPEETPRFVLVTETEDD